MIYLKVFPKHTSYEAKVNVGGEEFKIPNVSYCDDADDIHFNPYNLIEFYVGEITGTTPQTVSIYTDKTTSVYVQVSEGYKWYSYLLPKDKGLCAINGNEVLWDDDGIIKKVIVKANISYQPADIDFALYNAIISESTVEVSFKGSNTNNVTDMREMFKGCSRLKTLDLSGWDTSNVTDMGNMFKGCSRLKTLDLSGWDTSNVTTMISMFKGCTALNTIKMVGCKQPTIDKIKAQLTTDGISLDNVTIVTGQTL